MQNKKPLIILMFAILSFLIFIFLNNMNTKNEQEQAQNQQPKQVYGKVVIANVDLTAREEITADMVKEIDYPVELIHPNAAKSVEQVIGKMPIQPVLAGEIIMTNEIVNKENGGLSFKLEKDEVSFTIPASEISAAAGLIQVGDEVDILGLFDENIVGDRLAEFVLTDLRVIAIGQNMTEGYKAETMKDFSTITLAMQPEQANILGWAQKWGTIMVLAKSAYNKEATEIIDGITTDKMFGKYDTYKTKKYIEELKQKLEIKQLLKKYNEE